MQVYAMNANGSYGEALVLVAAHSEAQAIELASQLVDDIWRINYGAPASITLLPCVCEGEPRVLLNFKTGE